MRSDLPGSIGAATLTFGCAILFSLAARPSPAESQAAHDTPSAAVTPVLTPSAEPAAWAAFKEAWANITAYRTTITIFEQKGTEVQNVVFDYNFRKPSSATVRCVTGPSAGITLEWSGGDTVVAHRGGLLAFFKKTHSLHDPQVVTIRGSSIDQLSFGAFLTHSRGTPGTISQAAGPTILGIPTEAVILVPTSSVTDTGLTREIVDLSKPTNLPLRVLGYDGDALVRQIDFSDVTLER